MTNVNALPNQCLCTLYTQVHAAPGIWPHMTGTNGLHPQPSVYDLVSSGKQFRYVRLHGATGKYIGEYGHTVLSEWSTKLKAWANSGQEVFVAFNNTGKNCTH
jgi:uncharacterized protein YecE (DUF72 family)